MRIFAANQFIKSYQESSSEKGLYGAWVAASDFYRNLIRFGTFDAYRFFILPGDNKKNYPGEDLAPYLNDRRLSFKKVTELPLFLKDAENFIFFSASPAIFNIANLRSIYAKRYFPICGMAYTISYAHLLESVFFRNMVSDLQAFDSIICISKPALESVSKIHGLIRRRISKKMSVDLNYKARLDYLPLGINAEDYMKNNKQESRKKLKLPLLKTIILYFGRFSLSDKADLYPLLFAFKNLLAKNKNILLVLAGKNFPGNYGKKLEKTARELGVLNYAKFFLNPSQEEKYLLYAAGDIFISPSDNLQESFGLTVLEAMAAGLPVVVSDWNGYRDIVVQNKTGFCIPTYWAKCDVEISNLTHLFETNILADHLFLGQSVALDTKKMIEYLSILVKRKELRLKFGLNAKKRVLQNYDWSVVIPKYERLMATLMDKAKIDKRPPKATPIFHPQYFECFQHYPSRILNKRTNFAITREGIRLLQTRKFLSGIPPLNLISPKIVLLILFYLKERQSANIEKIESQVNASFSKNVSYHLMWMLKNYLVEVRH